ncbi:MAG: FAD-dependent oxidoreductase, partial [Bacteroidetes bacterium]|nr:FAD-dependent oxidoreductase [Bacteroidota bacterium]
GRLDTAAFRKAYIAWLKSAGLYAQERFEHAQLKLSAATAAYQQFEADQVIFAEGFGLKQNPYFNYLPLQGSKGELLTIYAPELDLQQVLKSTVFIIPLGDHRYRVGATYDNHRLNNLPTEEARNYLLERLRKFLKVDFEVEAHVAGVRPSVSDRKPLVGRHPQHAQLAVLNGFGSRGVMIAPFAADALYRNLFEGAELDAELDIRRFDGRSKRPQGRN